MAFHGNQLEYNVSQGANGAGSAGRFQCQGHEIHGRSVHNICTDRIIKQLTLVVKQCFFRACNKSDHLQLRSEADIILQIFALPWQCDIMEYSCVKSDSCYVKGMRKVSG